MNGIKISFGIYRGFRSGDVKVTETFQIELSGKRVAERAGRVISSMLEP